MPHVLHLSFKMLPSSYLVKIGHWKLPGEGTTKQNVNIVLSSKYAISNTMQDVTNLHFEEVFKKSSAKLKHILRLIDDTTKKSGTKMLDAKFVMITTAVHGDPSLSFK